VGTNTSIYHKTKIRTKRKRKEKKQLYIGKQKYIVGIFFKITRQKKIGEQEFKKKGKNSIVGTHNKTQQCHAVKGTK